MNGISGGGLTYHSEDDYDDNMYASSSSGNLVGGNLVNSSSMNMGGNSNKLSSSSSSYASSGLGGIMNPLSSLHGLTNQQQLIPASHHSSSVMSSSFMNTNTGGGNGSMSGLHGVHSSVQSTPVSTGGRNQSNVCCLVDDGRKCHRLAGNASYSKRVQKTVFHKRLRLENDTQAQHIYICDYHKMIIQNARTRQKKDSEDDVNDGNPDDIPEVDLYQLQVNTLRRYKKHYKISSRPGLNKAQLADILMRHFKTIPVQEKEIVTYFIYMVKSERNKLDNNRPEPTPSSSTQASTGEYVDRY